MILHGDNVARSASGRHQGFGDRRWEDQLEDHGPRDRESLGDDGFLVDFQGRAGCNGRVWKRWKAECFSRRASR